MKKPRVSVITPHHNRLEYLIKCIDNVKRMNKEFDFEHIIIDNGSFDGTKEWFRYIEKMDQDWWGLGERLIYIRNSSNRGDHEAKKQGINKANGTYIFTMDNDTILCKDNWFEGFIEMYEYFTDKFPEVGALMPRRWPCKNVIQIQKPEKFGFSFAEVTAGRINYGPILFYDRNIMDTMPYIGNYALFPPGKTLWKIWDFILMDQDYGTASGTRDEDDPIRVKYGYGDQWHKYSKYFESLVPTPGCKRDEPV